MAEGRGTERSGGVEIGRWSRRRPTGCTRQQTLPPSSLSRFLIPSRSLPPPGAISICPPESQTVSQLPTARVQRRRRTGPGHHQPLPSLLGKGEKLEEGKEDFLLLAEDSCQRGVVLWPWTSRVESGEMDKDCGGSFDGDEWDVSTLVSWISVDGICMIMKFWRGFGIW